MTPKIILEMTIMLLEFGIKQNDQGIVRNNLPALAIYSRANPAGFNRTAQYLKTELPPKMAQAGLSQDARERVEDVAVLLESIAENKGFLAERYVNDLTRYQKSNTQGFDNLLEVLQGAVDNHPLFQEVQS